MVDSENFVIVNELEDKKFDLTNEEYENLKYEIEHRKIDIKKTIKNTASGDILGVKYAYASPLSEHDEFPKEIPELLDNGKTYEKILDEEFIEKALECVEKEHGLYITLVYAMDESGPGDIVFRKEGSDYEIEDEDSEDYENSILVMSSSDSVLCNFHEFDEIYADMTSDYGINIRKVNGAYETLIGVRCAGLHCWDPQDFSTNWEEEPLNRVILRLMYDAIVFED